MDFAALGAKACAFFGRFGGNVLAAESGIGDSSSSKFNGGFLSNLSILQSLLFHSSFISFKMIINSSLLIVQ